MTLHTKQTAILTLAACQRWRRAVVSCDVSTAKDAGLDLLELLPKLVGAIEHDLKYERSVPS